MENIILIIAALWASCYWPLMSSVKLHVYSKSLCSLQSHDLLNAKDLWDMTYPKSQHGMSPLTREDPQ